MAAYRLSKLAETDLTDIANYTLGTWGIDQTIRYIDALRHAVSGSGKNRNWGGPVMKSAPAYAVSSTGGTSCSTGSKSTASWYVASFISACCPNDRSSTMNFHKIQIRACLFRTQGLYRVQ
jgi:hypothetical protein